MLPVAMTIAIPSIMAIATATVVATADNTNDMKYEQILIFYSMAKLHDVKNDCMRKKWQKVRK